MTEFFKTVEEQRQKLKEEKKDRNIVLHYFQRGAGRHYRLTKYESGREEIVNFPND